MLRYCTFSSIYTTTWCYATARSLQFTQQRDATLLHVLFNLHNYVMLRYCTFSSIYTGAPCYPKLSRETKVLHYSCNHSKGIFCLKKRRRDGSTLLVHTGSNDGMWKLAKQAIHNSLSTRINGSVNPKLLQGVRVFQWRWQNNDKNDLMSVTGHALSKRLRSWWMIKNVALWTHFPL